MIIKARWIVASIPPNLTNGQIYTVVYNSSTGAVVIGDTGKLYNTGSNIETFTWDVVSITDVGEVQIYP